MWMKVNQEICSGCGVCVTVCSNEAITLYEGKATIDPQACSGCGQCAEECPNGAIQPVQLPSPAPQVVQPVLETVEQPTVITPPARRWREVVKPVFTFLGREVAPRVVDVLVNALDKRLSSPSPTASSNPRPFIQAVPRRDRFLAGGGGLRRNRRMRRRGNLYK